MPKVTDPALLAHLNGGVQTKPADRKLTGELKRQQQDIAKAASDLAMTPDVRIKQHNEALKSGIDVKAAQQDLDSKNGTPPGDSSKYGAEYIASLPSGVRDLATAMMGGKYKGSITNSRNPTVVQAAIAAQHATHGQFDAGKYDERLALVKSLTNPKSQLGALNTALAHAGVLHDQAGSVAGTAALGHNPLSTGLNAVSNWWNSSSPEVATYEGTVSKYGPEQATAYATGTGAERQATEAQYSVNLPLDTKRALLANDARLFSGKIASLAHGYDMLGSNSPLDYLSPDAADALKKIDPDTYQKLMGPGGALNGGGAPPSGGGGGVDYSGMNNGGSPLDRGAAPAGSQFRSVPADEGNAFVDHAVRNGVPYGEALGQFRKMFPTATPFAPGAYNKALEYHKAHPQDQRGFGAGTKSVPMGMIEQLGNNIANHPLGVLAASAANSTTGGLPALAAGDQGRFALANMEQSHPNMAFAGNVGGNIAGALGTGGILKGLARAGGAGAEFMARNAGKFATAGGATYGGIYGGASNPDHPFAGAVLGAGTMLAGDGLGRAVLGPAGRALMETGIGQKAINGVRGFAGRGAFVPPAALPTSDGAILKGAGGNDLNATLSNLDQAAGFKLPYSLADSNPKLRNIAGSAARKSQDVRALAESTLAPRNRGQAERALGAIDEHLFPPGDIKQIMADARTRAQGASSADYGKAMEQPAPGFDHKLDGMLRTPAGESAAREAYTTALNNGENPAEMSFSLDPAGNPSITANPNWRTLQYMKQGLDSLVEKARDPVSGKLNLADPSLRSLHDLRTRFTGRLHDLNEHMKSADATYSGIARQGSAAQQGFGLTGPRVTPSQVTDAVASTPPANMPYLQQGYASSMADNVSNTQMSGNPYNRVNGTLAQPQKLASMFPEGAQNFNAIHGLENDMSRTAQEVIGGSPTAARSEADSMFNGNGLAGTAAEMGAAYATGTPPIGLLRHLRGVMPNADTLRLGRGAKLADQVGPALLDMDPAKAAQLLRDLASQNVKRRGFVSQTNRFGGALGGPILLGSIPQN